MIEVYLIITGLIFFAWLMVLVRQTQQGLRADDTPATRSIIPVNLVEADEAVVVAEARGRVVYANDLARDWFGVNGGTPNLHLMAQMVQPSDTLHDLFADAGHASFRLGPRRIDAVSHAIPGTEGRKMVVVMREMTATSLPAYADFDPLRALSIIHDISQATGTGLDLNAAVDAILRSIRQVIKYDEAEVTLWDPDAESLRPIRRQRAIPASTRLVQDDQAAMVYELGEGYSGWIAMYRQPLLIEDVTTRTDVLPKAFQSDMHSYVGVPLVINQDLVGTLELTDRARNAFSQRDVSLLQAVAGQVAASLQAAHMYHNQTVRVSELRGLQQIAEAMVQLSEPYELYGQLTQRIASLIDTELCGVLLYDDEDEVFRSQPPFYGVPDALIEHYQLTLVPDTELYTIWHHLPWWFTNDPNSPLVQAMGFDDLRSAMGINSMALVPMISGARRIGLLLVINKHNQQDFDEDDMRTLMSFASQAAIVTENARLYLDEQRRSRELGGLQQIAQAIGVLRSPSELYSQITARIASLMDVEMCGVLLYEPGEHVLASQQPFFGLDDESVNFYHVPSAPGSAVARLWQRQNTWFSNNLRDDPDVRETDLAELALQVGIQKTVIAALVVGGNRLGVIQVANRLDGTDFVADDVRLLSIFAGQAAILIDNARLYREMQRRTHEAEGLRAVTEIASQVAPLSETMEQVVIAIANLLASHIVAVSLVDEKSGKLVVHPEHVWGIDLEEPHYFDAYAPGFERSVFVSRRPFMSNSLHDDHRVLDIYQDIIAEWDIYNTIQVPLVIQDRSIGELTVANKTPGEYYTGNDLQLMLGLAPQVAAMVDRMRLYEATDQDLHKRVQELDALSRVSHELSQTLELDRMLDVIRQEALRSTSATAVSVVLLVDQEDWPAADEPLIDRRYGETQELTELTPLERQAVVSHEVLSVPDYDAHELDPLPNQARSALVVPISLEDSPVGLIHLYSKAAATFDQRVINFVLALTDQATVAIGNARRYQQQLEVNRQLRVRAERMGRLSELGELFRQGASLADTLKQVAESVQETVGFNIVLISVVDEREQVLRRTAHAGLPEAVFQEVQATAPPLEQARSVMQAQYKISGSYFLPAEGTEALTAELPTVQMVESRSRHGARAWDPEDLMLVPLYGARGRWLGLMSVDDPRSGRRPSRD
ncbi:MAG: GAF domain-containing protein, partial [Chloroflexi bacterium]|nr:GAF domain-containing protein [Chloroflexota bacterium]